MRKAPELAESRIPSSRASRSSRLSTLTDRKSTRLNSSHANISYAVFCLKKKMLRVEGEDERSRRCAAARPRAGEITSDTWRVKSTCEHCSELLAGTHGDVEYQTTGCGLQ